MIQRSTKWMSDHKYSAISLMICMYLLLGAIAHMSLGNSDFWSSVWWSLKHLIDPGFIGDDLEIVTGDKKSLSVSHAILGTAFTILGLILFMFIFIELITAEGSKLMDRVMNGSLPKDMKGHLVIFGSAEQLIPFINQGENKLREIYQVKEVALIVNSDEGMKRLNRLKIKGFDLYRMSMNDFKRSKISLQSHLAKQIIILSEDDAHAGDMIYLVERMYEERLDVNRSKLSPLNITLEVQSVEMERVLQRFLFAHRLGAVKVNLRLIDMKQLEARHLLKSFPLDGDSPAKISDQQRVILVILGWSRLARALIEQVRSCGLYNMSPTEIYQLCLDDSPTPELVDLFPQPDPEDSYQARLGSLEIHQRDAHNLKELLKDGWTDKSISQVTVISCGNQADQVVHHAVQWELLIEAHCAGVQGPMPMIVELPEDSSYRLLLDSDPSFKHLYPTSSEQEVLLTLSDLDAIPRRAHERYLEMIEGFQAREVKSDGRYLSVSHNDWDYLPCACQNWNRSTVDHFEVKLRLIANEWGFPHPTFELSGHLAAIDGNFQARLDELIQAYQAHKQLDEDGYAEALKDSSLLQLLETLSELEHDRWSSERYIQGWRYHPTRNDLLRRHPSLVEYGQLSHKEKVKDRNNTIEHLSECLHTFTQA